MQKDQLPEILNTKIIARTDRIEIEQVHLRFTNAQERLYERSLSREGSVIILPLLDDKTVLLVREYAVGLEQYCLGFPKGTIDPGETAAEAANRELKEEAGYGAHDLTLLCKLASSPSYSNHIIQVMVATDLYVDRLVGDEPEELEVVPWSLDEIDELIEAPDFLEARSLAALLLWLRQSRAN
jgi:ADP-ribose diphosphatase